MGCIFLACDDAFCWLLMPKIDTSKNKSALITIQLLGY